MNPVIGSKITMFKEISIGIPGFLLARYQRFILMI
jgi:hypothetical protein